MIKKLLLLLPFYAAFSLNCNKYEGNYVLNCSFLPSFSDQTLIVIDYKGELLGQETIAHGQSFFSGSFTTHDADSPDYYDVHLIQKDGSLGPHWIYSRLGVLNGSTVALNIGSSLVLPVKPAVLIVKGLELVSKIKGLEFIAVHGYEIDAQNNRTIIHANLEKGTGLALRVLGNGEPLYRQLYISDEQFSMQDTITVDWSAFKLENNLQHVKFGAGNYPAYLFVDAVSPDYSHFVTLANIDGNIQGIDLPFNRPAGIPSDWQYRVWCMQNGVVMDRFFSAQNELVLEDFDEDVYVVKQAGGGLMLNTDEMFDAVQLNGNMKNPNDPNDQIFWEVSGRMSAFEQFKTPPLDRFLPDWFDGTKMFAHGAVRAAKFDLYDYEQVQAGFPYSLNERFALPRSGFKELWKSF